MSLKMMLANVAAILVLCGFSAWLGFSQGQQSIRVPDASDYTYPEGRAFFTNLQAELHGKADTLIIGDSLVEQNLFADTCGRTFQAGIGGGRAREPVLYLEDMLANLDPETVVVAFGTIYFTTPDGLDGLARDYPRFIEGLGDRQLILVGIARSEQGNAFIREFAERNGHAFVDPPRGPLLDDGLHYSREGSIAFRQAIAAKCAEIR